MALLFGGFCFFQFIMWTAILCGGVILLPVVVAVDILGLAYAEKAIDEKRTDEK